MSIIMKKLFVLFTVVLIVAVIIPTVAADKYGKDCEEDSDCGVEKCMRGKCVAYVVLGATLYRRCDYSAGSGAARIPAPNCCVADNECTSSRTLQPCEKNVCKTIIGRDWGGVCDVEKITKCIHSDGCCPPGCKSTFWGMSADSDNDCGVPATGKRTAPPPSLPQKPMVTAADLCGNGVIDPPEECDGGRATPFISIEFRSPRTPYVSPADVIEKGNKQCVDSGKGTECKNCKCISAIIGGSTTGEEEERIPETPAGDLTDKQKPSIGRAYEVSQEISLAAGVIGILLLIGSIVFFVRKQK